jgi:AraC-like DNA-binding protein
MDTVLEELSIPVVGRGAILRRLCEVLFIQALRMHLGDLSWNDRGWFRALADPVLREHMHLAADPSASGSVLASAAHRSTRRIRSRFVQFSGSRPGVFVREARVWRAAALLRQGESDLEKIAALTGYGSRQALARAFRRRLGVSPTEYWRQVLSRPFPRARREPTCESPCGSVPSSCGWRDPAQPK